MFVLSANAFAWILLLMHMSQTKQQTKYWVHVCKLSTEEAKAGRWHGRMAWTS